jgi:hypothetical protein
MSEEFRNDQLRIVLEQIDERLRDAERLRNHVRQRAEQEPYWPDRRLHSRVPLERDHDE